MTILPLLALLMLATSALGQDYELDPHKLAQRYSVIQQIVAAGVPGKGGSGSKHYPRGTSARGFGAVLGSQFKPTGYSRKSVPYGRSSAGYAPVPQPVAFSGGKTYGGYDVNRLYAPRQARNYGYSNTVPNYGSNVGYKLGGGAVHPIFDNRNLYKPRTFNDIYGNVNSQEPIYLGGSGAGFAPTKDAVVPVKKVVSPAVPGAYPSLNPQFNAYNSYTGQRLPQSYAAGRDVIGGYTGQKGSLYGDLPGYSNRQFGQY